MGKRVIIVRREPAVYENLEEASKALGVSTTTVSKRLSAGDGLSWRERVYAIKTKDGVWHVCHRGAGDRGWRTLDDFGKKIASEDVVMKKEISEGWY